MSQPQFTVVPAEFTQSQWEELYNACGMVPRTYERHHNAKLFKRTRLAIEAAIQCLVSKSEQLAEDGGLEAYEGEDETWIADLQGAADVLLTLIGEPHISRKEARARLYELLTSDIYTDSYEYADRVAEVHTLLPIVFRGGAA